MAKSVVLVHGYSVRSLDTYGTFPAQLQAAGYATKDIYLSAFDSLNDDITCDDLARALEVRVLALEAQGMDVNTTAFITHSTGAIIVRRWFLNRFQAGKDLPSHFISLAGANHGSSLAQVGKTQLAWIFRELRGTSVGTEVLEDLDYGSEFLLQLNNEWLDTFALHDAPKTFVFSLIGDYHDTPSHQLAWQSHENGSDGTVRICGGNLNYSILSINQNDTAPKLAVKRTVGTAYLVFHDVAHSGNGSSQNPVQRIFEGINGIVEGDNRTMSQVMPQVQAALSITTDVAYKALFDQWAASNDAWHTNNTKQCNSTIVFSLKHPGGRKVEDSLILIKDMSGPTAAAMRAAPPAQMVGMMQADLAAIDNVTKAIEPRQPIQNDKTPSSVSFYVNYDLFAASYPHKVEITIDSGCQEIIYPAVSYEVNRVDAAAVQPNEFTYVFVTLNRQPDGAYELIPSSDNPDIARQWPPLPKPL